MQIFEATTIKQGNSIGIVIPIEVVKSENINLNKRIKVLILKKAIFRLNRLLAQ